MSHVKVLFFTADPASAGPDGIPRLLLDDDVRSIQQKVRAAEHRDALDFDVRPAARPECRSTISLCFLPHPFTCGRFERVPYFAGGTDAVPSAPLPPLAGRVPHLFYPLEVPMRKLRLDPENLVVEGFATTASLGGRGTVRGHDSDSLSGCPSANCPGWTNGCDGTVVLTGFDIMSATGCNNCICPNQVGGG